MSRNEVKIKDKDNLDPNLQLIKKHNTTASFWFSNIDENVSFKNE